MRLRRALLVLPSLGLALTLGACSGDDGDGGQADPAPSPSASGPVGDAEKGCTVELTVSGGAEATYSGEARVIRSAQEGQPKAIYMAAWGKDDQNTDVVTLDARLLGVEAAGDLELASVRFEGMLREGSQAAAAPFVEVWNFTRPIDRSSGWVLAGIQQVN